MASKVGQSSSRVSSCGGGVGVGGEHSEVKQQQGQ